MKKVNPYRVGLCLGGLFALGHFVWGILVLTGAATNFLDYVLKMHFLNNPFLVMRFELGRWLILLTSSFIAGYFIGVISGILWNHFRIITKKR